MAQSKGSTSGEGLSLQTLVIAAAASAAAAVVVSHIWKGGTVIAAAMTPVIVSIMKELLAKPMDSEIVRKPVKQVSKIASGRIVASATPRAERVRQAGKTFEEEPFTAAPPLPTERHHGAHVNGNGNGDRPDVIESHPRRTYGGTPPRRRLHLKVALVTGALAFVIAALVLTVPELVFGGAVTSHHSTTLFGGGSSKSSTKSKSDKTSTDKNTAPQPNQQQQQTQSQPTTPTTPQTTTPSSTTPAPTPTTPQSVAPPSPQGSSPPASGGTTPPTP